jgi:hypothetical protein
VPSGRADHRPFLVLVALGAALRVTAMVAYQPAFEFVQDSFSYLAAAQPPIPKSFARSAIPSS